MRLTQVIVDVAVNRHHVVVPRSHSENVIIDVIFQAVWYVANPWCLFGKEELTVPVPVQHLCMYCAGVTITHQDVRDHVSIQIPCGQNLQLVNGSIGNIAGTDGDSV